MLASTQSTGYPRQLAHAVAGNDAHVISVTGGGQRTVSIAKEQWAEQASTPILRANRRGMLKFHWVDTKGQLVLGEPLRGVRSVSIKSK